MIVHPGLPGTGPVHLSDIDSWISSTEAEKIRYKKLTKKTKRKKEKVHFAITAQYYPRIIHILRSLFFCQRVDYFSRRDTRGDAEPPKHVWRRAVGWCVVDNKVVLPILGRKGVECVIVVPEDEGLGERKGRNFQGRKILNNNNSIIGQGSVQWMRV